MRTRPPALLHLLLALVASWPLARDPRGALLGSPELDVWNHAWGPWWWWVSLSEGTLPWHTTLLRAPEGGVLWFIDPLLAAVGAPLLPLLGVAGAWNAALLLSLTLTSWSGAALARALGEESRPVGALGQSVAAAALTCSGAVLAALHNGVSEALHLWPAALALAAMERMLRAPDARRAAEAGALTGLAALASPYLGLGVGLALLARAPLALSDAGRRGRARLLRALGVWALVGGALGALGAAPLALQLGAADAIVRRPDAMDATLALHNATDPRSLLLPLSGAPRGEEGFAGGAYLGLVATGLALLHPRRAWLAGALICAICGLGPWLSWGGSWVELAGQRLPLPWRGLQLLLPFGLTHPGRLMGVALTLLAGLAGAGAERLAHAKAAPLLLPLVALDGLLLSGVPWPLPTAEAQIPLVYATLRAESRDMVLDLPTDVGASMATSRYLYWQTAHRLPIPYAPDARASTASLIDDPFFRALAATARRRADEQAATGLDGPAEIDLRPERLRDRGVRWIVLHPSLDAEAAERARSVLERALGPGSQVGEARCWELTPPR